ncbi:hypothetical protein K440DRAFT_644001 [Wilcoxina mikolae CBS 423.85]|nr:hypothetical protein K440DRAFT_644001 [Wilcoxina mikolae CBS 423.85]
MSHRSGGRLDIGSTVISGNNLTINIGRFDTAKHNKWSGQVELLVERKPVVGIVTGNLKKSEALAENASATERLTHTIVTESLQVESQEVEVAPPERIIANKEDMEDDDKLAVRKHKKVTDIPDGEHIFYLLYGISKNNDSKIFLKCMED